MADFKQPLTIAAVIVAGVVLAIGLRDRRGRPLVTPQRTPSAEKPLAAKAKMAPRRSAALTDDNKRDLARQDSARREAELGLARFPLTPGKLVVKIAPEPRCGSGDLDVISNDQRGGASRDLLLSIESIESKSTSTKARSKSISLDQLRKGATIVLPLEEQTEPAQLAIFLCGDGSGSKRCRGKQLTDIGAIAGDAARGGRQQDKIYFFQYLLAEKGEATIFAHADPSAKRYQEIGAYLEQRSNHDVSKGLAGTRIANHRLGSLPLRSPEAGTIEIRMPFNSSSACKKAIGVTQ